ncbi:hypothetical protein B5X24_HaOG204696 [Helicoverpa armigera]|uniref:Uncharacterized protein n=1 Tax=Helicoverpa armigera TaxID=29058 RepID=A0A2W1BT61_HELAM|nr:hypothetical protein B5X24_HaOG204696 [Helicoverpa armigera]
MIHTWVFFFVTIVLQTLVYAQTSNTLLRYRPNYTLNATVHLKNIPTNIDRYEISYNATGQGINCKILYSFLTCEANNDIERPRNLSHYWNQNVENLKIPEVVAEKTRFQMDVFPFDVNTKISSRIISQTNGKRDYEITTEPYTIFVPNNETQPFITEKIYYSQSDRMPFECTNNGTYKNVQIGLMWQNRLKMLQAQKISTDHFPNGMIFFCVAFKITTDDKLTTVERRVSQITMLVQIIKHNEKEIENNNNSPNVPNAPNYPNHASMPNNNNHDDYRNSAQIPPASPPQPDNNYYYTHNKYNVNPNNNNFNTKMNPTPNYPKQTPRTIPYPTPPVTPHPTLPKTPYSTQPRTPYPTQPVTPYSTPPMTTKPTISTTTSTTTKPTTKPPTTTTPKPTTTTTPKPTTTTTPKPTITTPKPTTTTTTKPTPRKTTKPTPRKTTKPTPRKTTKPTTKRTTKPTTKRTNKPTTRTTKKPTTTTTSKLTTSTTPKSTSYFTITPISNTATKTTAHMTTEITNAKMTVDKPTYNQPSTMENDPLSPFTNKTKYYMATGCVGIIVIVALIVYVVCKKRHKKSPKQEKVQELELETYATSALLYAELRLDPAKNTRQVNQNEETYAQIVGVLKPRESHGQKY